MTHGLQTKKIDKHSECHATYKPKKSTNARNDTEPLETTILSCAAWSSPMRRPTSYVAAALTLTLSLDGQGEGSGNGTETESEKSQTRRMTSHEPSEVRLLMGQHTKEQRIRPV